MARSKNGRLKNALVFDLEELSAAQSARFNVVRFRLNEMMEIGAELKKRADQATKDGIAQEDIDISDLGIPTGNELDTLQREVFEYMATVLVSVPKAWIVKRAPAEIDWSQMESFEYLKQNRMGDLMQGLNEAQDPESVTKN